MLIDDLLVFAHNPAKKRVLLSAGKGSKGVHYEHMQGICGALHMGGADVSCVAVCSADGDGALEHHSGGPISGNQYVSPICSDIL